MNISNNAAAALTPVRFRRWGNVLLWGGLAIGIFMTLGLVWAAPQFLPYIPLALIAGCAVTILLRFPIAHLATLLCGSVVLSNYTPGFQLVEVIYGMYFLVYLSLWYFTHFISNNSTLIENAVDYAIAIFLFGVVPLGIVVSFLFNGVFTSTISETIALSFVGFYFPVKKLCRDEKYGLQIVGLILLWFSLYFTATHIYTYYQGIQNAEFLWQIATERFYGKEMPLLIGSLITLVAFLYLENKRQRLISFLLFAGFFASLILTQSRGYWLDLILGMAYLFILQDRANKIKIVSAALSIFVVAILTGWYLFGDLATVALGTIIERFASIQTSLTEDISLVNRFYEWESVWTAIKINPILGYGLGTPYMTYDLIRDFHMVKSFTHNGVLSLWYRLGIFGLGTMLFIWGNSIYQATKLSREDGISRSHKIIAIMAAVCLVALIPASNTSNPFHRTHEILSFILLVTWVAGLRSHIANYQDDAA